MSRRGLARGRDAPGVRHSALGDTGEERETVCTIRVGQGGEGGHNGKRRVTPWHDYHNVSRLASSVAVRVGNPSYSYHPEGL